MSVCCCSCSPDGAVTMGKTQTTVFFVHKKTQRRASCYSQAIGLLAPCCSWQAGEHGVDEQQHASRAHMSPCICKSTVQVKLST